MGKISDFIMTKTGGLLIVIVLANVIWPLWLGSFNLEFFLKMNAGAIVVAFLIWLTDRKKISPYEVLSGVYTFLIVVALAQFGYDNFWWIPETILKILSSIWEFIFG